MSKPEPESDRMQGLDAAAHEAFVLFDERRKPTPRVVLDEPITVCTADPSWPDWFRQEAARVRSALPVDLVPEIQHIGSTAVPGLDAKPIVDLMVGISDPSRIPEVMERLERLGYESLGEAGVPGRWALRRRDAAEPSNIAIVAYEGAWWQLNLAVRDFLRANAEAARNYASAKWHAVSNGADMLLAYSEAKRVVIEMIVTEARLSLVPDPRAVTGCPGAGSGAR